MRTEQVPVLVVGGGGAGLTASMLLSTYGVQHLLVSATPTTSILPKAHVLNMRAMEILEDVGVADEIERLAVLVTIVRQVQIDEDEARDADGQVGEEDETPV